MIREFLFRPSRSLPATVVRCEIYWRKGNFLNLVSPRETVLAYIHDFGFKIRPLSHYLLVSAQIFLQQYLSNIRFLQKFYISSCPFCFNQPFPFLGPPTNAMMMTQGKIFRIFNPPFALPSYNFFPLVRLLIWFKIKTFFLRCIHRREMVRGGSRR